jgi:hypothetical protein
MKKLMFVLLSLALAVSAAVPNVSATKQANGTWNIVWNIDDWQANPDATKIDPTMAGKTITFGSNVTVELSTLSVLKNGKWLTVKQSNPLLVTTTDWVNRTATATLAAVPSDVVTFKVRFTCRTAKGESQGTNGYLFLNQADPAYSVNPDPAYELVCDVASGTSKPAK